MSLRLRGSTMVGRDLKSSMPQEIYPVLGRNNFILRYASANAPIVEEDGLIAEKTLKDVVLESPAGTKRVLIINDTIKSYAGKVPDWSADWQGGDYPRKGKPVRNHIIGNLRLALRGKPEELHAYFQEAWQYEQQPVLDAEWGEVLTEDLEAILKRLGDARFSDVLKRETPEVQAAVGNNLDAKGFPKTQEVLRNAPKIDFPQVKFRPWDSENDGRGRLLSY